MENDAYRLEGSAGLSARGGRSDALIEARPSLSFTGFERVGGVPTFMSHAQGAYIVDVDGHRYVDLMMGYGSAILGHAHPVVTEAAIAAMRRGVNPSLLCVDQVRLAERICALVPSAERVTFLKTGSDAVDAAVRLARCVTGKRHVLTWGNHGWHDWCASRSPGVLAESSAFTHGFSYGDVEDLARLFASYPDDVACVVMMPYEIELPPPGYFDAIRRLCDRHGSLLVLDEVRSGFRVALGGAQQAFRVDPDLTALSKAMANGHPISALCGRRRWMQHVLALNLTITYYRGPVEMAASLATLDLIEEIDAPSLLAATGMRLMGEMTALLSALSIPATMVGHPATPLLRFHYTRPQDCQRAHRIFCNAMLRFGVLINPMHHWFLATAHGEQQVDEIVMAARGALQRVATLMRRGS